MIGAKTHQLRITILGCGASGGVPRIAGDWGACDPADPRNRRTRSSIMVERCALGAAFADDATTRILIDTSPDLREQILRAGVRRLDGVLYSHEHADQAHGIDDLRGLAQAMWRRIPVWMDASTADDLVPRFRYCFEQAEGSGYPAILDLQPLMRPGVPVTVPGPGGPITATPLLQDHGHITSLGFRIGPFGYSNDLVDAPAETWAALANLDLWIVDALRYAPHSTHAHLDKTLGWIESLRPKRAVLTNMNVELDYARVAAETPDQVEPAFDGWSTVLELAEAPDLDAVAPARVS